MQEIVLQGGVWGPIECSVQIDTLGKETLNDTEELYKHKNMVKLPPLAMIDDIAAITKSGVQSIIMNAKINAKIESKRLELGKQKCIDMHIGKHKKGCDTLKVHDKDMLTDTKIKYL